MILDRQHWYLCYRCSINFFFQSQPPQRSTITCFGHEKQIIEIVLLYVHRVVLVPFSEKIHPLLFQIISPPCPIPTQKNGSVKQLSCLGGGSRAALMAMSRQWQRHIRGHRRWRWQRRRWRWRQRRQRRQRWRQRLQGGGSGACFAWLALGLGH